MTKHLWRNGWLPPQKRGHGHCAKSGGTHEWEGARFPRMGVRHNVCYLFSHDWIGTEMKWSRLGLLSTDHDQPRVTIQRGWRPSESESVAGTS